MTKGESPDALWARHSAEWRDPAQIATQWEEAAAVDPALLRHKVRGGWWEIVERLGLTLLVTREYEHLVMGLSVAEGRPHVTFMRMPHPSGLAVHPEGNQIYVASTRNPNQVFRLAPVTGSIPRLDAPADEVEGRPLVPVGSTFYPGALYMHDLAFVGSMLHANAVGHNAVVRLSADGRWRHVWWPRSIETHQGPDFRANYLQLNSIAAGRDLGSSYFSASAASISSRRPGHANFPVDGRGVVFSGCTREPVAKGLTRPHSARIDDGTLWVDNSGYGEVGIVADGRFKTVARLPGWTRGLCFASGIAFVGTSCVIPRFRQYAPGLDTTRSVCAIHAIDARSGTVLGSLVWPSGNQIFAVEALPSSMTSGFPFLAGRRQPRRTKLLFYSFRTDSDEGTAE